MDEECRWEQVLQPLALAQDPGWGIPVDLQVRELEQGTGSTTWIPGLEPVGGRLSSTAGGWIVRNQLLPLIK